MNAAARFAVRSGRAAPGVDAPYGLQHLAADRVIAVVEIDGRIAVRNDAGELVAMRELLSLARIEHAALFVAEEEVCRAVGRAGRDPRRIGICGERLQACVGRYKAV